MSKTEESFQNNVAAKVVHPPNKVDETEVSDKDSDEPITVPVIKT